jgi:precorrin-6A/cobalt-precorrin-6A reductase
LKQSLSLFPTIEIAKSMQRILILGGTGEAFKLADRFSQNPNLEIITSLAGRTANPIAPPGKIRIGGFGGVAGLIDYLKTAKIDFLIDATHPFAAQISWHGAEAAIALQIPHLMLVRPGWERNPDDVWIEVETVEAAAVAIPKLSPMPRRIFLTIGRQQLAPFAKLAESFPRIWFLIRSIQSPDLEFGNSQLLLEQAPFSFETEMELLNYYQIEAIVTKNSGGNATYAKILAARQLQIPVIMVQRPALPESQKVNDIEAAIAYLSQYFSWFQSKAL